MMAKSLMALTSLGFLFTVVSAQDPKIEELRNQFQASGRIVERFAITDQGVELRGLKLTEVRSTGEVSGDVSRLLVMAPGQHPLVVTWVSEPRTGRVVTRLTDDRTGWWAELWLNTGIEAEDGAHAVAIAMSVAASMSDSKGSRREPILETIGVRTSDGLALFEKVDVAVEDQGIGELVDAVTGSLEWGALAGDVPDALVAPLVILNGIAEREVAAVLTSRDGTSGLPIVVLWNDIASVLLAALQDAGVDVSDRAAGNWVVTVSRQVGGRLDRSVDADDLELAAQFRSVSATDPLPEREVTELLLAVRRAPDPANSGR